MQSLSIIIPVYNESESLPLLWESLEKIAHSFSFEWEVLFVDDGSGDESFKILKDIAVTEPNIRIVRLKRNFGQTAALAAGIELARGATIVTLDSDLENDPADIPFLLKLIDEGNDIVSGNRLGRWKGEPLRRVFSHVANRVISSLSGVHLHDFGCTLKAYQRDVFDHLKLYGQMHRMIPAYASWMGYRVTETDVTFTPRKFGKSHYTAGRFFSVVIDLVTLKFMLSYFTRPAHFFGKLGIFFIGLGGLCGLLSVYFKLAHLKDFIQTPLPIFMAFLIIMGFLSVFMGVFGEILTRIYFESQKKEPYVVEEKVNYS